MIQRVDHLVILVDDLERARADYAALGFVVVTGGEHADGRTHNALVSFADGAYLELIAFKQEAPQHVWWHHVAAGQGLIDFALLPGDTAEDVAAARARGLEMDGPYHGGRNRPDGVRLEWQTARAASPELPFFCGDVTPRALRVPGADTWDHDNGVRGLTRVSVAVRDLDASADRYAALLGSRPLAELGRRLFKLGETYIALRSPGPHEPESAPIAARLDARGEGVFSFTLRSESHAVELCDLGLAHGARITID
ncbi:VOC family protein [Oscillochloris sp. ZM17-4]|uniref:VOC family protein n=1 Tax=Oscillochloris sp. ZM17-4 TaxID=2866714 RepID=UPI001C72E6DF|nr:VOC family protein [Oscillochloris sp. ZM17-4]MBX0329929.1 VOC family protein [Oscillochloris sp. ZM17-4]